MNRPKEFFEFFALETEELITGGAADPVRFGAIADRLGGGQRMFLDRLVRGFAARASLHGFHQNRRCRKERQIARIFCPPFSCLRRGDLPWLRAAAASLRAEGVNRVYFRGSPSRFQRQDS